MDQLDRRAIMRAAGIALTATSFPGLARPRRKLSVSLLGQSLIQHDICSQNWARRQELEARLGRSDIVFSDLETAIDGPRRGQATRVLETLHVAHPRVIGCLRRLGINLLATSNNHAFDVGTGGILDALEALAAYRVPHAGIGRNISEAAGPVLVPTRRGSVALVAFATGMVREGGAATETRAGVAEIRRRRDGELEQEDVARTIAAVAAAAQQADLVIAYQHNHYWETDNSVTPQWQRSLARKLIDAGAGVFVGHGAPLLQGLEVYSGRPLFYGLGSFIFQTKKAPEAYSAPAWQSLIAECRFAEGKFQGATLIPVQLNAAGVGGAADLATRGRPTLARGEEARRILNRLAFLSARLGHVLRHDGRTASVSS